MTGLEYILFIKGVSGTDLAEVLEVSPQLISHFVKGRRTPSEEQLNTLQSLYGVPKDYLTKQLEGKDRIEIEIILGAEHTNLDISKVIQERDNLAKNYAKLYDEYTSLSELRQLAISLLQGKPQ